MTEKTLVLGLVFLIDHDSEDGAANGSDDSGSDQDFLNNAESRRGGPGCLIAARFFRGRFGFLVRCLRRNGFSHSLSLRGIRALFHCSGHISLCHSRLQISLSHKLIPIAVIDPCNRPLRCIVSQVVVQCGSHIGEVPIRR